MIEFTFRDDQGNELFAVRKTLTPTCGGGCCFDAAVADFRAAGHPEYTPGRAGVVITIKGV